MVELEAKAVLNAVRPASVILRSAVHVLGIRVGVRVFGRGVIINTSKAATRPHSTPGET